MRWHTYISEVNRWGREIYQHALNTLRKKNDWNKCYSINFTIMFTDSTGWLGREIFHFFVFNSIQSWNVRGRRKYENENHFSLLFRKPNMPLASFIHIFIDCLDVNKRANNFQLAERRELMFSWIVSVWSSCSCCCRARVESWTGVSRASIQRPIKLLFSGCCSVSCQGLLGSHFRKKRARHRTAPLSMTDRPTIWLVQVCKWNNFIFTLLYLLVGTSTQPQSTIYTVCVSRCRLCSMLYYFLLLLLLCCGSFQHFRALSSLENWLDLTRNNSLIDWHSLLVRLSSLTPCHSVPVIMSNKKRQLNIDLLYIDISSFSLTHNSTQSILTVNVVVVFDVILVVPILTFTRLSCLRHEPEGKK